ncbi:hypothetical protein AMAG_05728 [Allomyces macrogynus ATCC 38327]|uniref:JmjC domain-containing protein n=1 Tax=Allomyces macrogynus (strain ATCC 38327) TaxID=578462 RepID=A0A0L0SCX3_ALLM3|nr:hypothetical protein AMAG_05728 [Allomyces macrogynus ATCC 38327]|eukprot:KNE60331.1 hypothetical protein AMAG_05728 [Allomyces macrogynus ATCC 38327]
MVSTENGLKRPATDSPAANLSASNDSPTAPSPAPKRTKHFPTTPSVAPHPLGIRPLGNLLFARQSPGFVDTRTNGLGPFAQFDDEFLLAFLVQYLDDPRALCALSRASKAWYAFWAYDEIWKGWVLEKWRTMPPGSHAKTHVATGWRHTYIHLVTGESVAAIQARTPAAPIQIPHFYSDLLFHPHLYASVPLTHLVDMLEACTAAGVVVPWDTVTAPTPEAFIDQYERPNTPCLLRGCMTSWRAMKEWDWDALVTQFGQVPLRAEAVDMALAEYLAYMRASPPDEALVYLFDKDYPKQGDRGAQLAQGFSVPPYFAADLFSVLGETRPDFSWLIVGPTRSGSTHHKDPNATSAWNAVVRGAKLWILYPPDVVPPGVFPSDDGANVSTPVSLLDWWLNWFPQTRSLAKSLPRHKRPRWGICREGEIAFVPQGWWHTVINLEPSIAITQNYVSPSNLRNVLEFLLCNRDMISGYGNADDAACVVGANSSDNEPAPACSAVPSAKPAIARPGGNGNLVDARELYENFVTALRAKKADDALVMQILDAFEAEVGAKVNKPVSLWDSIVKGDGGESAASFSLFG